MTQTAAMRRGNGPAAFRSAFIDNVVHIPPWAAVLMYLPLATICAVSSARSAGYGTTLAWFSAGYAGWTLFEYWGHRLILHFSPEAGVGARFHWLVHGLHHEFPQDMRRSIMSPFLSVPLVAGVLLSSHTVIGLPLGFTAGFVVGYLAYDLIHLYLHHARPRNRIMQRLKENHMRHHFRDDTRGFGVSAPYWDLVFGTSIGRSRSRTRGSTATG